MGKGTSVHALVRDLAFAGRALRRRPGFAAVVILTSGLNRAAPAAVVLLLVASVGCWVPARRATRVDPAMALRG